MLRDYEALYTALETDGTIYNIVENDSEIEFRFNAMNIDLITEFLKPQIAGADISPFSTRNLPKEKYAIPAEDMNAYKHITSIIPVENKLLISHYTNDFLNNILSKDKLYKTVSIKTDMRKKMLNGKEYIHSMGYWNKYLKYLEGRINEEKR